MRLEINRLLKKMNFKSDKNIDKANSIFIRLTSNLYRILEKYITKILTSQTLSELIFADNNIIIEI
jgi:hypothetical protein